MTCDDSDALTRDVVAHVECVASEPHPRHSVVDLRYLLSGSVIILVYPHLGGSVCHFSLIHIRLTLTMQMECSQYRGSTVGFNTCLNLLNPQFVRSTAGSE